MHKVADCAFVYTPVYPTMILRRTMETNGRKEKHKPN